MAHRVVTSRHYHASLIEVQREWTLCDLLDAHAVIDALDDAEARAAKKGAR